MKATLIYTTGFKYVGGKTVIGLKLNVKSQIYSVVFIIIANYS